MKSKIDRRIQRRRLVPGLNRNLIKLYKIDGIQLPRETSESGQINSSYVKLVFGRLMETFECTEQVPDRASDVSEIDNGSYQFHSLKYMANLELFQVFNGRHFKKTKKAECLI